MFTLKTNKHWVLELFQDTIHTKKIRDLDEQVQIDIGNVDDMKSYQQMKAYRQLVQLFSKAPECSWTYEELHDRYKSLAGLVKYDKKPMSKELTGIQRKIYSMIDDKDIKEELVNFINNGTVHYRSAAEATKEQMSTMIVNLLKDIADSGCNDRRIETVRKTLEI